MRLLPAERSILFLTAFLAAVDAPLLAFKGVRADIAGYAALLLVGALTLGVGQYYRVRRNEPALALAVTGTGLFVVYSLFASLFNYALLPVPYPRIDDMLVKLDAALGFDWPAFANWLRQYGWLETTLRVVYLSSMPQLALVIIAVGCAGDQERLHRMLLAGVLGSLLCIVVWSFAPSSGAIGAHAQNPDFFNLHIVVDRAYILKLNAMIAEGVSFVSPSQAQGLIGFPSFHAVMACMAVAYAPRQRVLRGFIYALNLPMAAAIVYQGGHHLMDVLGGVAVFAVAHVLARAIVVRQARQMETAPAVAAA